MQSSGAHPVVVELEERVDGTLSVRTPAKVNLLLLVGAIRPDGYHEVDTLMVAVDLFDEIEMVPGSGAGGTTIEVLAGEAPAGDSNLCVRAARLYAEATGTAQPRHLRLRKRIPTGAGLGGGSGNAAGVLLGLDHLSPRPLGPAGLTPLAARLGADVTFFLTGGAARCRGRGELVTPLLAPIALRGVIVYPGVNLSTARVYAEFEKQAPAKLNCGILSAIMEEALVWAGAGSPEGGAPEPDRWINHLEAPALALCPPLRAVAASLAALNLKAILCGSGSSFFVPLGAECDEERTIGQLEELRLGDIFLVGSTRAP